MRYRTNEIATLIEKYVAATPQLIAAYQNSEVGLHKDGSFLLYLELALPRDIWREYGYNYLAHFMDAIIRGVINPAPNWNQETFVHGAVDMLAVKTTIAEYEHQIGKGE